MGRLGSVGRRIHHEGHEELEVKKFKNINVRNLRVLRVLRGELVFLIQEVRNDASEGFRSLGKCSIELKCSTRGIDSRQGAKHAK